MKQKISDKAMSSSSKKDPSLRVAANDPHLVSLGGGRLSTAVTIHNIPVGDCTIGSSSQCSISLNGAGVRPVHCTIYRSEENEVTLVPERNARILIDSQLVIREANLRQGAMITIGDSYCLRYNNPAEALQMRSAMEDISENEYSYHLSNFYESNADFTSKSGRSEKSTYSYYDNLRKTESCVDLDILAWQCPKVFTADLVTVNMSAEDVGQKYARFAKKLAEHHRNDKNVSVLNTYCNINSNVALNNLLSKSKELVNKEISINDLTLTDPLEDMLKICAEYTDRQDRSYVGNSSITSSPIVQNRIKTNGSLPRDKKSPFYQEFQNSFHSSNNLSQSPKSSGYENVITPQQNNFDLKSTFKSSGYENVKLAPQSPRTKIRTNCISSKKNFHDYYSTLHQEVQNNEKSPKNYEDLMNSFEVQLQKKIDVISENSKLSISSNASSRSVKRTNKNVNNLTIDIKPVVSPCNSPTLVKKPSSFSRRIIKSKDDETGSLSNLLSHQCYHEKFEEEREDLLQKIMSLKAELNLLQIQDNETLIQIDMEQALIIAELHSRRKGKENLEDEHQLLQQKIYRLEAQRNATRVMEENQQLKFRTTIEMKEDQVEKLKELLKNNPTDICLKEEISNVRKSLENDKKNFEDLEFQYLEGESEWQAYRDDLNVKTQTINKKIMKCQLSIENFEKQQKNSFCGVTEKQHRLSTRLFSLMKKLHQCEKQFQLLEKKLFEKITSNSSLSEQEDDQSPSTKANTEDLISKSVNGNVYCSNRIEILENEKTVNRDDTCKMFDTVKKIKMQSKLLTTRKGLWDLDCEKRKIEELLKNLNSNVKQKTIETTGKYSENLNQKVSTENNSVVNNALTHIHSLSDSKFESSYKKSLNELSISSPDSRKTLSTVYKRSSSVISNEGGGSNISSDRKSIEPQKQQRPLTRYLPIFAEDLDLRRHIESAGHPISLCTHVNLDTTSCRGYLNKLGSTFHTWAKRWFVLDRRRSALIYYAEKSEGKPRGGTFFSSIDEVYMDHLNTSKSSRPRSTFIVKTKKRSFYLQASSDTAARIWIDAIITGAQGNIDY